MKTVKSKLIIIPVVIITKSFGMSVATGPICVDVNFKQVNSKSDSSYAVFIVDYGDTINVEVSSFDQNNKDEFVILSKIGELEKTKNDRLGPKVLIGYKNDSSFVMKFNKDNIPPICRNRTEVEIDAARKSGGRLYISIMVIGLIVIIGGFASLILFS
jgi:hypothetical protein